MHLETNGIKWLVNMNRGYLNGVIFLDLKNNTWYAEIPDLFRVLNLISGLTLEINLVFPSTRVLFCLLYKHSHAY